MSMPEIALGTIPPRDALATVMASIALQEAALSHVLNAEGEKIQAVVGLTGATMGDLQGVNDSVGTLVGSVSSLEGELHRKLRTALEALYPGELPVITTPVTVRIVDENGLPVPATGSSFTLINVADPLNQYISFPVGSSVKFNAVKPGQYIMQQTAPADGHTIDPDEHTVQVLDDGTVLFDGADASQFPPTVVNATV